MSSANKLSIKEVCDLLQIKKPTLYAWRESDIIEELKFPALKTEIANKKSGKIKYLYYYDADEIQKWLHNGKEGIIKKGDLLTTTQIAKLLKMSTNTLRGKIFEKQFVEPFIKISYGKEKHFIRYKSSDVFDYFKTSLDNK